MGKTIVLDTNIFLGILHASNHECMELMDYLISEASSWVVVMCDGIYNEISKSMPKVHTGIQFFNYHVLSRLNQFEKLVWATERKNGRCLASHNDDQKIIDCASGSSSEVIITLDRRLRLSSECEIMLKTVRDFLSEQES